mgnify:FL=1
MPCGLRWSSRDYRGVRYFTSGNHGDRGRGPRVGSDPQWRFWPPPDTSSRQYHLFWWPFRVYFVGLVTLSIIDFTPIAEGMLWWRLGVGLALFVIGFGLALYGTDQLGWANAHGAEEGLKTGGMYRWSRNPIYVVTIPGLLGLGLLVHSALVYPLVALWALIPRGKIRCPWRHHRAGLLTRERAKPGVRVQLN